MSARPASSVQSGDALFAFDSELTVVSWNAAAEELTGIPAGQAVGRSCWEALGAHDDRGGLVCHAGCSLARLARERWPVACRHLVLDTRTGTRDVWVSTITLVQGDDRQYLHVLVPREHRSRSSHERRLLTPRQQEVLRLLAAGVPAKQIALELGVVEVTVRNHVRAILVALGAHSQLEAIATARRLELIE